MVVNSKCVLSTEDFIEQRVEFLIEEMVRQIPSDASEEEIEYRESKIIRLQHEFSEIRNSDSEISLTKFSLAFSQ
jgi:hypothetical protein